MNNQITFIGDVHQNYKFLYNSIDQNKSSSLILCVGDIELGQPSCPNLKKLPKKFKFLQGNHDSIEECNKYSNFLGRFGYIRKYDLFYIGGAMTPPHPRWVAGYNWWDTEELTLREMKEAADLYNKIKPSLLVTHDCNESIARLLLPEIEHISNTQRLIENLKLNHQPKYHVFGHWHTSFKQKINNTFCTCVPKHGIHNIIL